MSFCNEADILLGSQIGSKFTPCSCQSCGAVRVGLQEPEVQQAHRLSKLQDGRWLPYPLYFDVTDSLFSLPSVELKGVRQVNENIMKWSPGKYKNLKMLHQYTNSFSVSERTSSFYFILNAFALFDAKKRLIFKYTCKAAKYLIYYIVISASVV